MAQEHEMEGEGGEEENKAAWLRGIKTLRFQPYRLPPLDNEVCELRHKEANDDWAECAGVIEEVGSEVKTLVMGERVVLEPGISCRQCHLCKEGRYNLYLEMKFFGLLRVEYFPGKQCTQSRS